jgi:hypothetical protein
MSWDPAGGEGKDRTMRLDLAERARGDRRRKFDPNGRGVGRGVWILLVGRGVGGGD